MGTNINTETESLKELLSVFNELYPCTVLGTKEALDKFLEYKIALEKIFGEIKTVTFNNSILPNDDSKIYIIPDYKIGVSGFEY